MGNMLTKDGLIRVLTAIRNGTLEAGLASDLNSNAEINIVSVDANTITVGLTGNKKNVHNELTSLRTDVNNLQQEIEKLGGYTITNVSYSEIDASIVYPALYELGDSVKPEIIYNQTVILEVKNKTTGDIITIKVPVSKSEFTVLNDGYSYNFWDTYWINGYLNENTGQFVEDQNAIASKNFIRVFPGISYKIYNDNTEKPILKWFSYSKDKTFISSQETSGDTTLTFGIGVKYVRFCTRPSDQVTSYSRAIRIESGELDQPTRDLFDGELEVGGIDPEGQPVEDETLLRTKNFIKVFPNSQYFYRITHTGLFTVYYYDSNHQYINKEYPTEFNHLITPDNCTNIKFYVEKKDTLDFYIKYPEFNLWNEQWESGIYKTIDGTKTSNTSCIRSSNPIKVHPGYNYIFKVGYETTNSFQICQYDANLNYLTTIYSSPNTGFTVSEGVEFICFNTLVVDGKTTYKKGEIGLFCKESNVIFAPGILKGTSSRMVCRTNFSINSNSKSKTIYCHVTQKGFPVTILMNSSRYGPLKSYDTEVEVSVDGYYNWNEDNIDLILPEGSNYSLIDYTGRKSIFTVTLPENTTNEERSLLITGKCKRSGQYNTITIKQSAHTYPPIVRYGLIPGNYDINNPVTSDQISGMSFKNLNKETFPVELSSETIDSPNKLYAVLLPKNSPYRVKIKDQYTGEFVDLLDKPNFLRGGKSVIYETEGREYLIFGEVSIISGGKYQFYIIKIS